MVRTIRVSWLRGGSGIPWRSVVLRHEAYVDRAGVTVGRFATVGVTGESDTSKSRFAFSRLAGEKRDRGTSKWRPSFTRNTLLPSHPARRARIVTPSELVQVVGSCDEARQGSTRVMQMVAKAIRRIIRGSLFIDRGFAAATIDELSSRTCEILTHHWPIPDVEKFSGFFRKFIWSSRHPH